MGKDSLCTFTIRSNRYKGRNRTGDLFSPTYPGLHCQHRHQLSEIRTSLGKMADLVSSHIEIIIFPMILKPHIILFSTRNLSEEHKMWLQVYRRSRPANKTRVQGFRPFLWWSSVSVGRNLSQASLSLS